jgi:3-oxoacyl-[acyl-carrier protein] reductase
MDLGLKGKVAIVAASSRGIGRATAAVFAAEGARVAMCARTLADLREAADEIRGRTGAETLAVQADLTKIEDIRRLVAVTVETFGTVDILATNAGGPPPGVFEDMDDAKWQEAFELTLLSTVRLIREVVPHMRKAGGGAIVNLQSTSVKAPLDNLILSNGIRPAVVGLAKALSLELARDRIRVNNVLPGAILTDRLRQTMRVRAQRSGRSFEEVQHAREGDIPMGRIGEPEDVAHMVVFLASDRARYVTGVTVQVDGGMVRSLL